MENNCKKSYNSAQSSSSQLSGNAAFSQNTASVQGNLRNDSYPPYTYPQYSQQPYQPAQGAYSCAPPLNNPSYPMQTAQNSQPGYYTPIPASLPHRPPFTASVGEKIAAFLAPLLGYIYTLFLFGEYSEQKWWLFGFSLGFLGLSELILFSKKRSLESYFWLFCLVVTLFGIAFGQNRVWGDMSWLFLHLFGGWYVFSRANAQLEGESGALLPMDAANAFFAFPFKNFILEVRVMVAAIKGNKKDASDNKKHSGIALFTFLAVLAGLILFIIAVNLLMDADPGFAEAAGKVFEIFRIDYIPEFFGRLIFAIPVGLYAFGMIAGDGRERSERLKASSGRIRHAFSAMRKVPNLAYSIILAVFCVFYLLFFIMQGSYLFGAFFGKLPEGFIVSQYARQGFFELCRVMTLNFALLWIVTQTGAKPVREHLLTKTLCITLLIESILFAAVAFSKLVLYISSFGFTPLRLQSSWLVCVLFFGCLCAMYSILRGKKSFKVFLLFSAVTLSILCIY